MKPRSGLSTGGWDSFCFFSSKAIAAESVRGLRIVPALLSATTSESLQVWIAAPMRVAQPERRSLDGPPAAWAMHLGEAVAFFPTHSVSSLVAAGRRETEYIKAAKDETATASSSNAISSSPITKPRRPRFPGRRSAFILVFHPVIDPGVAERHERTHRSRRLRNFAGVVVVLLGTVRGRRRNIGPELDV